MKTKTTFLRKVTIVQSEPWFKIITRKATGWGLILVSASFRKGSEHQTCEASIPSSRLFWEILVCRQDTLVQVLLLRDPASRVLCNRHGAKAAGHGTGKVQTFSSPVSVKLVSFKLLLFVWGKTDFAHHFFFQEKYFIEITCLWALATRERSLTSRLQWWVGLRGPELPCLNTWDARVEVQLQRECTVQPAVSHHSLAFLYIEASVFRPALQPLCSFLWGITDLMTLGLVQGAGKLPGRCPSIPKSASLPRSKVLCLICKAAGRWKLWKFLLYLDRNKLEDINSVKLNSNTDLENRQDKLMKKQLTRSLQLLDRQNSKLSGTQQM